MSVINDNNNEELMTAFNEMESKFLILIENMKKMDRRLRTLEEVPKHMQSRMIWSKQISVL